MLTSRIKHETDNNLDCKSDAFTICAKDNKSLNKDFGDRGLDLSYINSRTERHKTNNGLEEEIYILRRYLFSQARAGKIDYPINLVKSETPDFIGTVAGIEFGIEVTEATLKADQREMTLNERDNEHSLLGKHRGRYHGGIRYDGNLHGSLPDRDLTADVIRAIRRKRKKPYSVKHIDLLLYPNGNAAMMAEFDTTLNLLKKHLQRWQVHLLSGSIIRNIAIVWDSQGKVIVWSRDGDTNVFDIHASLD